MPFYFTENFNAVPIDNKTEKVTIYRISTLRIFEILAEAVW